jgi:predicted secreted protein
MQVSSAIAIFVLFWVLAAFVVLPFGIRNLHEAGEEAVPGQDLGAPANFNPKTILIRTTILGFVMFAIYYLNYVQGWLTPQSFDGLFRS